MSARSRWKLRTGWRSHMFLMVRSIDVRDFVSSFFLPSFPLPSSLCLPCVFCALCCRNGSECQKSLFDKTPWKCLCMASSSKLPKDYIFWHGSVVCLRLYQMCAFQPCSCQRCQPSLSTHRVHTPIFIRLVRANILLFWEWVASHLTTSCLKPSNDHLVGVYSKWYPQINPEDPSVQANTSCSCTLMNEYY